MRIQFMERAKNRVEVEALLNRMAKEAKTVLSLKPNKNYVSPGKKKRELFVAPSQVEHILTFLFYAVVSWFAFADQLPLKYLTRLRFIIGGQRAVQSILLAILVVNALMALSVIALAIWSDIPLWAATRWSLYTLVFGFATMGPFTKLAYYHKEESKKNDEIQQ